MNVGRIFREEGERREAAALISTTKAPRTWSAMLDTWSALATALCSITGLVVLCADVEDVWRAMWALPPCSEARKAAFTLGAAAMMIERWQVDVWRVLREGMGMGIAEVDPKNGQRAEALLRIAAWHIDDARGEAHARTLGHEPMVPPHERVYERDDGRFLICHTQVPLTGGYSWESGGGRIETAREILDDYFQNRPGRGELVRAMERDRAFAELAIASLPDGPWVMTTRDVGRFIEIILEDAGPC